MGISQPLPDQKKAGPRDLSLSETRVVELSGYA